MSKRFTMKKQTNVMTQYRGDLFYDMPAPLRKYRKYDRKRMEMFDINADTDLREEDRKFWKSVKQRKP